jgi:hypothetical protein
MNGRSSRRGYAMMLVLLFIALVLSFFSLSYRHLAAALRVETTRALIQERDEGSTYALAAGLALLETGLPPSNPYACDTTIETPTGLRGFTVTFTRQEGESEIWSVQARPTGPFEEHDPMPETFAPPEEPPEEPPES